MHTDEVVYLTHKFTFCHSFEDQEMIGFDFMHIHKVLHFDLPLQETISFQKATFWISLTSDNLETVHQSLVFTCVKSILHCTRKSFLLFVKFVRDVHLMQANSGIFAGLH